MMSTLHASAIPNSIPFVGENWEMAIQGGSFVLVCWVLVYVFRFLIPKIVTELNTTLNKTIADAAAERDAHRTERAVDRAAHLEALRDLTNKVHDTGREVSTLRGTIGGGGGPRT